MITVWVSRMILVDSLCRWSRRRSVIRACTRATVTRALARFAEPFCFFATRRRASASRARSRRSCLGLVIFSPVDRVTRDVIPASIPAAEVAGGSASTGQSTRIEMCHRPAASRLTGLTAP
jgi:hypothetical protein